VGAPWGRRATKDERKAVNFVGGGEYSLFLIMLFALSKPAAFFLITTPALIEKKHFPIVSVRDRIKVAREIHRAGGGVRNVRNAFFHGKPRGEFFEDHRGGKMGPFSQQTLCTIR
jgi:hypothetical protein